MISMTKVKIDKLVEALTKDGITSEMTKNEILFYSLSLNKDLGKWRMHQETIKNYIYYIISLLPGENGLWSRIPSDEESIAHILPIEDFYDSIDSIPSHEEITLKEAVERMFNDWNLKEISVVGEDGEKVSFRRNDGLFTLSSGSPVINKGKYKGCNVKDNESLKKYFENPLNLYSWVLWCLNPETLKKSMDIRGESSVKEDVDILMTLKNDLESRINFPTVMGEMKRKNNLD